jgi:predicted alpha/beta superfamily hydrolase
MHVAVTHPDLFGGLLLESPSFYVDDNHILRDAAESQVELRRIYLGVGTNELNQPGCPSSPENTEPVEGVQAMARILQTAGLEEGPALKVVVEECAVHNEEAWAGRLPLALEFLFPPGAGL